MFWSLGSFENFPKETSEAWRMQLGGINKTSRSQLVAGVWRAQVH